MSHPFPVDLKLALIALVVAYSSGAASAEPLLAPGELGQYNVGTTTFPATVSGGRGTLVQVFYPTLDDPDCGRKYTIQSPAGPYQVTSPYCAVENAAAAPGPFPLIAYDHGGAAPGGDFQRVAQAHLHELLASHGFVTVVALHAGNPLARVRDLPIVIDIALALSANPGDPLQGILDPERIGVSGFSAGGFSALGVAGGVRAQGIGADPRVKAMVVYEPSQDDTLVDVATISFPYLIMGGTHFRNGLAIPALFAATTEATPRFFVKSPGAIHFNYLTSLCPFTEETREAALLANPLLPEPLTTFIVGNPAAITAFTNWNFALTIPPSSHPGFGSARNVCDRTGVDSVRSLDTSPADGFTDSPPFIAIDPPFTLAPALPAEVMVPAVQLYTVAFWKAYLADDHRYMRYLTPGYARTHSLPAEVTILE